jgi:hypothetical protein
MPRRCCRFCQQSFEPSKFRPDQSACSRPDCQRRRRGEYHRRKIGTDPEYAEVVRDSRRKWREAHPDYQKNYGNRMKPQSCVIVSFKDGGTRSAASSFL